jgi:hypothetical protein
MNSGAYSCPSLKPHTFDTIGAAARLSLIGRCVSHASWFANRAEGYLEQQSS